MLRRILDARAVERVAAAIAFVILLAGCGGQSEATPEGTFEAPVVEFRQVFADEFDGTTLDTSKWTVVEGDGCPELCGFGNNELQVYSADNVEQSGGILRITARENMMATSVSTSSGAGASKSLGGGVRTAETARYTSGRVDTKDKFEFRYGRVEISARLPSGQGMWPALWLLHADPDVYGPWPASGEIDIMESFNPGVMGNTATQSTTHYGLPGPPFTGTSSQNDNMVPLDAGFHEYALEWERDQMRFFVDGVHFQTQTSDEWYAYFPADEDGFYDPLGAYKEGPRDAPFDQLFYLIMNLAVGGDAVGPPEGTVFPQTLEIDYVRVFECVNANPDTGRGCGSGDRTIEPLEDNDGGPLEDVPTDKPFVERLDLYVDGPEAITVNTLDGTATNMLSVDGFTGDGATVVSDPTFADPDDPENTVWRVAISGGVANVFLASQEFVDDPFLRTGFDFSGNRVPGEGTDPFGEVAFDMEIVSIDPGARILVKLDSGFPNLGEFEIPAEALAAPGVRKTYSVKFQDFLDNPGFVDCCGGAGVDLANVINPFVLEVVGGSAEVLLDDIYVTNACKVVGGCGADLKSAGLPDLVVFDDEVNLEVFDLGIGASDSGTAFTDYFVGTDPSNKVNWAVVPSSDMERGDVIEVTFNDSSAFGVWFIKSTAAVDISGYSAGAFEFDIRVTDYGTNTTGITAKLDCFFPCTSGDQSLGVIADGEWETVSLPLAGLPALDLEALNTGIVVFPSAPQSGGITFEIDNVRFVAETAAPPPTFADLPVTFDDPDVTYSTADFGGNSTVIGADPDDADNKVAVTTKNVGAETFAGTVITDPVFPNPVPFAAGETEMSMRVRAPEAGATVLLKLETADGDVFTEVTETTTAADTWETLVFDFSTVAFDPTVSYERAIVFFDFGFAGDGTVYLWDDVAFGPGAPDEPVGGGDPDPTPFDLPVTFDDDTVSYDFIDFNGTGTTLIADPEDATNTVAQTIKGAGDAFAGTTLGSGTGFATAIPIAPGATTLSMRVRTPAAGTTVMLKLETPVGFTGPVSEVRVDTTVANEFERLVFDFSTVGIDVAQNWTTAVVFFEPGTVGDGTAYLWDDLQFGTPLDLPVTFDTPGVDYQFSDFNGTFTQLVADPDDAGNQVAQTTKGAGDAFAGTIIGDGTGFENRIAITPADRTMTVRVRAPAAGIEVLLKLETAAGFTGPVSEVRATTTAADAWETLTFDFATANIDTDLVFVQAVIFFDPGNVGGGEVYLWEDVQL